MKKFNVRLLKITAQRENMRQFRNKVVVNSVILLSKAVDNVGLNLNGE